MQTDFFLVRHGESHSNIERRLWALPPGPGLTPRGRLQAEAACRNLLARGVRPQRVLSSPMLRALETAEPLLTALDLKVEIDAALTETGFGSWEGRTNDDLWTVPQFQSWLTDPEGSPPPGGESLTMMGKRVGGLIRDLAAHHAGYTIVCYSHGHPIIAFVLEALGRSHAEHATLDVLNATIVHMRWNGEAFHLISIDRSPASAGEHQEGLSPVQADRHGNGL